MKFLSFRWALLFLPALTAAVTAPEAIAQTFHVRAGATGAKNGSDWDSAYSSLPATLQRGATYYVADGSYGSYNWNTANSGSAMINVKKATNADHGVNAGWQSSYGDGQAVWTYWVFSTDNYFIDGQVRNANWQSGAINQYGFRVASGGGIVVRLDNGSSSGKADNVTFRRVDMEAGGRDTGRGDDVIYGVFGPQNITFTECALHESDRTIFLFRGGWQNLLIEYCYIARNSSSAANHGEICSTTDGSNIIWRCNVIEDPEGTAVWAFLNGGTASGWEFYGNLIFHSASYNREGIAGVIYCANDASNNNTLNNTKFYNNTIYGIKGTYSGLHIESGSGNIAKNNIWHSSVNTGNAGFSGSYNWYFNTPGSDGGSNTQTASVGSIFVDPSNENFHLSAASVLNAGDSSIGSTYNKDIDGATRGADGRWDRGAFEFVLGGVPTPTPTPYPTPSPTPTPGPTPTPTPTPTPGPTPTPSPTPTGSLTVGGEVIVDVSPTLRVRSTPMISGTILGTQNFGAKGTIIGGPTTAEGYTWWQIDYEVAPDGWSIEGIEAPFLMLAPESPSPPSGLRIVPAG